MTEREVVTLTPEEKAYFRAMCPLVLTRGGNFRIIDAPKKKGKRGRNGHDKFIDH